jgi:hypothetical protein
VSASTATACGTAAVRLVLKSRAAPILWVLRMTRTVLDCGTAGSARDKGGGTGGHRRPAERRVGRNRRAVSRGGQVERAHMACPCRAGDHDHRPARQHTDQRAARAVGSLHDTERLSERPPEPEPGAFGGLDPDAQDFLAALDVDADGQGRGPVLHGAAIGQVLPTENDARVKRGFGGVVGGWRGTVRRRARRVRPGRGPGGVERRRGRRGRGPQQ